MDYLARREHSQYELKRKLRQKNWTDEEIDAALAKLAHEGLQCDERFTEQYVNMRINAGYGPRRIALELQQRGVSQALIAAIMPSDRDYWLTRLRQVCERKRVGATIDDMKTKARLTRFLLQRGFEPEQVQQVLE